MAVVHAERRKVARPQGTHCCAGLPMVLRMLDLPEALQQHFVEQLADATTAGRLAQANQDCKELLR